MNNYESTGVQFNVKVLSHLTPDIALVLLRPVQPALKPTYETEHYVGRHSRSQKPISAAVIFYGRITTNSYNAY